MMVYLDHNSTTPLDQRVVDAMMPFLREDYGNPSSSHALGARAAAAIASARSHVGDLVGADPAAVTFCSSATEAINTVLSSIHKGSVITTDVEHAATLGAAERLEAAGVNVVRLPVDREGQLDLAQLRNALDSRPSLVSVLWANNETGAIFPVQEIAALCAQYGVPLHVDAVQAAGKLPIDLRSTPIDYLSVSAHKINGPKGVAALVINSRSMPRPLLVGGPQEHGRRAGTENVAGIVGFGAAALLAASERSDRERTAKRLRDALESSLCNTIERVSINARGSPRIFNTANVCFEGVDGDDLVTALDSVGVCISAGSACHAQATEPSHVIRAMTGSYDVARSSVRFSLSHTTTEADIEYAGRSVAAQVRALRSPG